MGQLTESGRFVRAFIRGEGGNDGHQPGPSGGCCKFGADCGDCGDDGTGWCHQSAGNCAVCTGQFDSSTSAPTCSGSAPSPTPSLTPSPIGGGSGCCKWGGDCGDCGNDGSGWCHQSSSNCAACTGFFDSGAQAPACR